MIALVAQIDPEPAGFGLPRARCQNVDRRVVGINDAAHHDMFGNQLDQRSQQPSDMAEPFGKLAAIDIETGSRVDLGLPIQLSMDRWGR
jgi:hypothetical protein